MQGKNFTNLHFFCQNFNLRFLLFMWDIFSLQQNLRTEHLHVTCQIQILIADSGLCAGLGLRVSTAFAQKTLSLQCLRRVPITIYVAGA